MSAMPSTRPLGRNFITEGSVIVLPAYPVAFVSVGLILLLQAPSRTSTAAFDAARFLMPIHAWGWAFLIIALAEGASALLRNRRAFTWLLVLGSGLCAFWATLLFWSAASSPLVSFTGGVWLMHIAWCHIASIRSLTRDLVVKR